jgi:thiamine-phosphate pyrophosphorylase
MHSPQSPGTLPRLYAITDEKVVPNHHLLSCVEEVLRAGVRLLQLRFKTTPPGERLSLGRKVRSLTSRFGCLMIVNDSPQLALETGADGVHLGAEDPTAAFARELLGPDAIIGISCSDDEEQLLKLRPEHVSYVGMLSPYPSTTKSKANIDLERFGRLTSLSRVPVYGIGGITPDRVPEMMAAGCHGVAVISAIFGSAGPGEAVRRFIQDLSSAAS